MDVAAFAEFAVLVPDAMTSISALATVKSSAMASSVARMGVVEPAGAARQASSVVLTVNATTSPVSQTVSAKCAEMMGVMGPAAIVFLETYVMGARVSRAPAAVSRKEPAIATEISSFSA